MLEIQVKNSQNLEIRMLGEIAFSFGSFYL